MVHLFIFISLKFQHSHETVLHIWTDGRHCST